MYIDILGTVSVTVDGERHELRANKVRTMLATLALDVGRAVSTVDLADELWGGHVLGNDRNALQANATRLRKILDGPARQRSPGTVLRAVRNGYLLDVSRDRVDSTRFLDLTTRGSAALRTDPDHALRLLLAGLQVWRGPALLDAGDGLRCRAAAVAFEERRLSAWEDVADARVARGDDRGAVADLQQLVGQFPLRERFREQLMLALYRCGRQGDALDLFRSTRRLFDKELGLLPGRALHRRHAEILAQDPGLMDSSAVWSDHRVSAAG